MKNVDIKEILKNILTRFKSDFQKNTIYLYYDGAYEGKDSVLYNICTKCMNFYENLCSGCIEISDTIFIKCPYYIAIDPSIEQNETLKNLILVQHMSPIQLYLIKNTSKTWNPK